MKNIKITQKEQELLEIIMSCETNGVGSGFSEFIIKKGRFYGREDIIMNNIKKGVLSSLLKKGLIYDSYYDEETGKNDMSYDEKSGKEVIVKMYCTFIDEDTLPIINPIVKKLNSSMEYPLYIF